MFMCFYFYVFFCFSVSLFFVIVAAAGAEARKPPDQAVRTVLAVWKICPKDGAKLDVDLEICGLDQQDLVVAGEDPAEEIGLGCVGRVQSDQRKIHEFGLIVQLNYRVLVRVGLPHVHHALDPVQNYREKVHRASHNRVHIPALDDVPEGSLCQRYFMEAELGPRPFLDYQNRIPQWQQYPVDNYLFRNGSSTCVWLGA